MNRVIGVLSALVFVCACAPGASAKVTKWKVNVELSGTYANSVTATAGARCGAAYRERVTGLKATFASPKAIGYDPVAHAFTGPLRYRISGKWAVTGAYNAQVPQPDGTLGCAATATPVSCGAEVVFEDGRRTSTAGSARLSVDSTARHTIISRITAPRLTEQYADADTPPASWPNVCTLSPDDETLPATPPFGLSTTAVLDRALATKIRLPTSKLQGRRRFTVRTPSAHPNGCPAQGFDPCTESGSFRVTVTLSPV
jgi:hypothetical protein